VRFFGIPDVAHDAAAVAGTMRMDDQHRQVSDALTLKVTWAPDRHPFML
jgi:hypothetical protein